MLQQVQELETIARKVWPKACINYGRQVLPNPNDHFSFDLSTGTPGLVFSLGKDLDKAKKTLLEISQKQPKKVSEAEVS